jgi:putative restriction endonuclease
VLDAAHIRPFSETAENFVLNGLLLRSDVHRLFDAGYVTVTPELKVEASRRMKDDFNDGDTCLALHGSPVRVPEQVNLRPDPEALRWHNDEKFRG